MNPKVSVILSTYNHLHLLPMAVDSILNQIMKDFEFIIIDDGSTDNTLDYLKTFTDERIHLIIHQENRGVPPSYTEGLKIATGDYIFWASADNYHLPDMLQQLSDALDNNPDATLAYSSFHWINSKSQIIGVNQEVNYSAHNFMMQNPGVASFLYRRFIHDEMGYLEDIGCASDTDFWVRMLERYPGKTIFIPKILMYYLLDETVDSYKKAVSGETAKSIQRVIQRAKERRTATMDKPRILFVTHTFPPESYTGTELYSYHLARGLMTEYGYNISVLHRKIGEPKLTVKEYEGIKIYNIFSNWDTRELSSHCVHQDMEKNFTSLLDREKFDIIHFQHILGLPLSLIDIAKKCGYPACISLHDFWYICPLTFLVKTDGTVHHYPPDTVDECVKCILKYEGELNYNQVAATHFHLAYRKYYSKHILNKVDIVTCASKYVQRIYKEFYGIYIRLLPLGIVPFTRIEPPSDRPLTFGFFGAVCAVKNILMMVNAFKSVKSDIRLVIWGGGILEYIDEVMKAIADDSRIEYKGLYKPEDLPRVLSSMDISIHPSLNESYSLTIRESLMAGVPVIVSNAEAYKEIIDSTSFYAARFETQIELENIIKKIATDGSTMLLTMKESIPEIRQIKMDVWEWKETYEKLLR